MAFVPAGRAPFVGREVGGDLLVDQFEVTRGEWRRFVAEAGLAAEPPWDAKLAEWAAESDAWPAAFMTAREAGDFAARSAKRLPRTDEWLLTAAGAQGRLYPWSDTFQESVANTLELGLRRPVPVGTFESGRTPQECYDMCGNVWEWCADALTPPGVVAESEAPLNVAALGGSYLYFSRPIYSYIDREFCALSLDPDSRSDDIGFRCAADAGTYLWERAPHWSLDAASRQRLLTVGRRFGAGAVPLLESLTRRPGAAPGLAVLLDGARS